MRILFFILAIFLVVIAATVYAINDPGYVLFVRPPWSMEISFTFFVISGIVLILLTYTSGYVIYRVWIIPRQVEYWRRNKGLQKSRQAFNDGLTSLAEADWQQAEASLISNISGGDSPLIHYLGAAFASQLQNNPQRRDEYLQQALKECPESSFSISMTQALLQQQAGQYEQALAILTDLKTQRPGYIPTLVQLANVHKELADWPSLATLTHELQTEHKIANDKLINQQTLAHIGLLAAPLPNDGENILNHAWQTVPKNLQKQPVIVSTYCRQLMSQARFDEAEKTLRRAINENWHESLVKLYGQLELDDIGQQLKQCDKWLADHPDSIGLLNSYARLRLRQGELEIALTHLKRADQLGNDAQTQSLMAQVLEMQGKSGEALKLCRQVMEQGQVTAVPLTPSPSGRGRG